LTNEETGAGAGLELFFVASFVESPLAFALFVGRASVVGFADLGALEPPGPSFLLRAPIFAIMKVCSAQLDSNPLAIAGPSC